MDLSAEVGIGWDHQFGDSCLRQADGFRLAGHWGGLDSEVMEDGKEYQEARASGIAAKMQRAL